MNTLLIELGAVRHETIVSDGHTVYYGAGNHQAAKDAVYAEADLSTAEVLLHQYEKPATQFS